MNRNPLVYIWTMLSYIICIFLLNKKYTRTPSFTNTLILTFTTSITWAHYNSTHSHHTPTTTTYPTHIIYNNHTTSTTSTYHNPTNSHVINQTTTINPPPTLIPHINITTYIGYITYVTHTHLKKPKTKITYYYTWNNSIIILLGGDMHINPGPLSHTPHNLPIKFIQRHLPHQPYHKSTITSPQQYYIWNNTTLITLSGDIESNPGPMPDLLNTHPTDHKRRQTTYFIPSTIKFQPEYQHLAKTFQPFFQTSHPLHAQTMLSLPYLYQYIQTHVNHPHHGSYTH